jgi:hypothetical protein
VLSGPNVLHHRQRQRKLGYFWVHAYLKAKSGPTCGGLINPNFGLSIIDGLDTFLLTISTESSTPSTQMSRNKKVMQLNY